MFNHPSKNIIRQSPLIMIFKIIVLEIIIFTVFTFVKIPLNLLDFSSIASIGLLIITSLAFTLVELVAIVYLFLDWYNEYYLIYSDKIIHTYGFINSVEEQFSLTNVEAFTVSQGIWGKWFNFGTISFYSPVLKTEYSLNSISDPRKTRKFIDRKVFGSQKNSQDNSLIITRDKNQRRIRR